VSESNQEDSKTIEKLNRKIDDIQCVNKIIIVLIVLIIATQASQIIESPDFLSFNLSPILLLITAVFFILAAITMFCTSDNRKTIGTS